MFEADQAYAGDSKAFMELGPEARGDMLLHDFGVNTKVREDASADYALNGW